jgi:hypothetical protein
MVDGEQVLGELFEQAIGAALQRAEQAGAPIPYSDEGLGLLGSVVQQVMGNTTQEQVDDAWRSFLTEPPVRRDWPRRGYDSEQVRAVLQWVTSAGEFSLRALVSKVWRVVCCDENGKRLPQYVGEYECGGETSARRIAARVLRRAKRDRVVAWSHHSRCYYVRPAWQWRRPMSRWWKWSLSYSDNPAASV